MIFSILGSFEVSVDGQVLDLGPPKQRALLAVLLLHANQTVATERLVELVWDDGPPRTAAHSVQVYVSELRKRFEEAGISEVISTRRPGYVLHAEVDSIDSVRFERLLASAEDEARGATSQGAQRRSVRRYSCGAALPSRTSPTPNSPSSTSVGSTNRAAVPSRAWPGRPCAWGRPRMP